MTTNEAKPSPRKLRAVQKMVLAQNALDAAKRIERDLETEFRFVDADLAKAKTAFDAALASHKDGQAKLNAAKRTVAACESDVAKISAIVKANRTKAA